MEPNIFKASARLTDTNNGTEAVFNFILGAKYDPRVKLVHRDELCPLIGVKTLSLPLHSPLGSKFAPRDQLLPWGRDFNPRARGQMMF
jgi:hypothetical protein